MNKSELNQNIHLTETENTDDIMILTWADDVKNIEENNKVTFDRDMSEWFKYYLSIKKEKCERIFIKIEVNSESFNLDCFERWAYLTSLYKPNHVFWFKLYTSSMKIFNQYINVQKGVHNNNGTDREIIADVNMHFVLKVNEKTSVDDIYRVAELRMSTD